MCDVVLVFCLLIRSKSMNVMILVVVYGLFVGVDFEVELV